MIADLSDKGNLEINIFTFLSGKSSPNIEISRLRARGNVSVTLDRFYHKSPDYLKLVARIEDQEKKMQDVGLEDEERRGAKAKLTELRQLENAFKIDILYLADIFLRIDACSERLTTAKALFEIGKFSEADELLAESDLTKDQDDLLLAVDFWERRMMNILDKI